MAAKMRMANLLEKTGESINKNKSKKIKKL